MRGIGRRTYQLGCSEAVVVGNCPQIPKVQRPRAEDGPQDRLVIHSQRCNDDHAKYKPHRGQEGSPRSLVSGTHPGATPPTAQGSTTRAPMVFFFFFFFFFLVQVADLPRLSSTSENKPHRKHDAETSELRHHLLSISWRRWAEGGGLWKGLKGEKISDFQWCKKAKRKIFPASQTESVVHKAPL